jgi:DNA-binding HxlR family transcriptional regulator
VEYSLTEQGEKLIPILKSLYQWGEDYIVERQAEDKVQTA